MKNFTRILIFIIISASTATNYAQVGIGTAQPNSNALLDIDASVKAGGLLLPRVGLSDTNSFAPLAAHVAGMIVYNTATAGVSPNNVTPGYYYSDGSQWVRTGTATATNNRWSLTGNVGTVAATDFLGTTDGIPLRLRTRDIERFEITEGTTQANGGRLRAFTNGAAATPIYSWNSNPGTGMFQQAANVLGLSTNGTERMRIAANGNVGIGTAADPTQKLEVTGNIRLSGAFMPGNSAGSANQILLSNGTTTPPTWTPFSFQNNAATTTIGKYFSQFSVDSNWASNTYRTFTIRDVDCRESSSISVSLRGPYIAFYEKLNIANLVVETGQFRVSILNATGTTITTGTSIPISFFAFY